MWIGVTRSAFVFWGCAIGYNNVALSGLRCVAKCSSAGHANLNFQYSCGMGSNDGIIALALLGCLLGGVLLAWAATKYLRLKSALQHMETVMGIVVDVDQYRDSSPAPGTSMAGESKIDIDDRLVHYKTDMYRPVVAFRTSNGTPHLLQTGFSSNKVKKPGDAMEVVYHPNQPEKAQLKAFYWFWVQLLAIFGGVLLFIGLCALVLALTL